MLKLPTKVNNKRILVAPFLVGLYLAIMFPLHQFILAFISARFGVIITNNYPVLTGFILYISTVPLAIFLSKLIAKKKQSYDEKLIVSFASNVTFNITLSVIFYFIGGSIGAAFGILFFATLFGFVIGTVVTIMIDNIEAKYSSLKTQ